MSRNQQFRHVASPTKISPEHAAAIRASDEFDKEGLVAWHLSRHHDALVLEKGTHPEDVLPALPQSPSAVPKELKPIALRDLKIGKVHRGRVLRGTFCTKTVKMGSVVNVLEDENGMATMIFLQNVVKNNCSTAQVQKRFPTGLEVAIRNPYLHEHHDGMIGILVEKADDIIMSRVPEECNGIGNGKANSTVLDPVAQVYGGAQDTALETSQVNSRGPLESEVGMSSKCEAELSNAEMRTDPMCNDIAAAEVESISIATRFLDNQVTQPGAGAEVESTNKVAVISTKDGEAKFPNAELQGDVDVAASGEGMPSNGSTYSNEQTDLEEQELEAAVLRRLGNEKFAQGQWEEAAVMYTRAISKAGKCGEEAEVLLSHSNRAEANLRLKQYDKAREDAETALCGDPKNAKSLYRLGRALVGLGRLQEGFRFLEAALIFAPQDKDLKQSIQESRRMLRAARRKSTRSGNSPKN